MKRIVEIIEIGMLMFGFVGFWNEVNWRDELKFKWR